MRRQGKRKKIQKKILKKILKKIQRIWFPNRSHWLILLMTSIGPFFVIYFTPYSNIISGWYICRPNIGEA